jgi:CDP-6-deoxy-D-xylo-4-hexulose-3-dehydrase
MFESMNKDQAARYILENIKEYYQTFMQKAPYKEGDRIPYASRVFDEKEIINLVDSSLEFWLTSGRYTDQFETQRSQ